MSYKKQIFRAIFHMWKVELNRRGLLGRKREDIEGPRDVVNLSKMQ